MVALIVRRTKIRRRLKTFTFARRLRWFFVLCLEFWIFIDVWFCFLILCIVINLFFVCVDVFIVNFWICVRFRVRFRVRFCFVSFRFVSFCFLCVVYVYMFVLIVCICFLLFVFWNVWLCVFIMMCLNVLCVFFALFSSSRVFCVCVLFDVAMI